MDAHVRAKVDRSPPQGTPESIRSFTFLVLFAGRFFPHYHVYYRQESAAHFVYSCVPRLFPLTVATHTTAIIVISLPLPR